MAAPDARILILGSLPGVDSIAAQQYYAHPRNAFWPIMAAIAGVEGNYEQRCAGLMRQKIALWDVLQSSVRPGSLDANIEMWSCTINDFADFLARHGALQKICFNGQKAAKIFSQHIPAEQLPARLALVTLPSTSPAHASMSFDEKLQRWQNSL